MQLKLYKTLVGIDPGKGESQSILVITGSKEECDRILAEFQRVNREKMKQVAARRKSRLDPHLEQIK